MAIRVRRGLLDEFDPSKLLSGEWAVSIDADTGKQQVFMCFGAGLTKRMGTYDDFQDMIEEISADILEEYKEELDKIKTAVEGIAQDVSDDKDEVVVIQTNITDVLMPQIQAYVESAKGYSDLAGEYKDDAVQAVEYAKAEVTKASGFADNALESAELSSDYATLAESYTHGNGTREGDATDNAKYYMEQAKAAAGGDYIATSEKGVSGGVATLDDNGKVPDNQLPEIATDAEHITFDDSVVELGVDNVQDAIDTLNKNTTDAIADLEDSVQELPQVRDEDGNIIVGEEGQVLTSNGDGTYSWGNATPPAPKNSIENWCKTIGLSYTNLADISQADMRKLMTMHVSVDFLREWMKVDTGIQNQLLSLSNTHTIDNVEYTENFALKWMGLRDYAYDTITESVDGFLDKWLASDWWEYALKDHVPVMTSNDAPYGTVSFANAYGSGTGFYATWKTFNMNEEGGWLPNGKTSEYYLQYEFTNPINVRLVSACICGVSTELISESFVLSASNDGSNWETIKTGIPINHKNAHSEKNKIMTNTFIDNDGYYKYYRVHTLSCGASYQGVKLQLYGRSLNVSVPVMTSNTEPWGEVIYSGEYGTNNLAYYAFNTTLSKRWINKTNGESGAYVGYVFQHPIALRNVQCKVTIPDSSTSYQTTFKMQYRLQNGTWVDFGETGTYIGTNASYKQISIDTNIDYVEAVRLYVVSETYLTAVYEFNAYGVDYSEREFAEGSTMKYLYDHGVELEAVTEHRVGSNGYSEKRVDYLYVNSNVDGLYGYKVDVDLTNYQIFRTIIDDTVTSSTEYFRQMISPKSSMSSITAMNKVANNSKLPYQESLDISSLNGQYSLLIGSGATNVATFNEWWLEG